MMWEGTPEIMWVGHSRQLQSYLGVGTPEIIEAGHKGFSERCAGRTGRDWASKSGLVQNPTAPYRRWESKRMHKQGEKRERRKVVLDAEGFERTGASLIVNRTSGFVACLCFRAHMRASMCNRIRSCVHVQFRVHNACASEHMSAQACVAAYTHVCIMCTCVRASCAHAAYPSEHMCAHACVTACIYASTCGFMFTCVCYCAHVRARALSCTHACASDHIRVQACLTAYTHVCIMCTCVCFRAHVRASMWNVIHSCVHVRFHARMHVLPRTCACTCNFMCRCVCFRSHVRASMGKLRRATLHDWPAGGPQCIVQPVPDVPDKITVAPSTHTSLKLQLRRATLHYWPAGVHMIPACCSLPSLPA